MVIAIPDPQGNADLCKRDTQDAQCFLIEPPFKKGLIGMAASASLRPGARLVSQPPMPGTSVAVGDGGTLNPKVPWLRAVGDSAVYFSNPDRRRETAMAAFAESCRWG